MMSALAMSPNRSEPSITERALLTGSSSLRTGYPPSAPVDIPMHITTLHRVRSYLQIGTEPTPNRKSRRTVFELIDHPGRNQELGHVRHVGYGQITSGGPKVPYPPWLERLIADLMTCVIPQDGYQ